MVCKEVPSCLIPEPATSRSGWVGTRSIAVSAESLHVPHRLANHGASVRWHEHLRRPGSVGADLVALGQGAQDARPFPGIDEAAHIEPLRAAVEVGRHAVRWHAAKLMLSIDAVLRRVGSLIGVLVLPR